MIIVSFSFWWSSSLPLSLCHQRSGPLLVNLPLCPLLQTSAVSNLALWPTSPLPIYLHISPIASAPLSFPCIPHLYRTLYSCCSPAYQLPSLPLAAFIFPLVFLNLHCSSTPSPSLLSHPTLQHMLKRKLGPFCMSVSRTNWKPCDQMWMKFGGKITHGAN